jgi:hypothetical protein
MTVRYFACYASFCAHALLARAILKYTFSQLGLDLFEAISQFPTTTAV